MIYSFLLKEICILLGNFNMRRLKVKYYKQYKQFGVLLEIICSYL